MGIGVVFTGGKTLLETTDKRSFITFYIFLFISFVIVTFCYMCERNFIISCRRFPERLKIRTSGFTKADLT